jgi:hypothetical protein
MIKKIGILLLFLMFFVGCSTFQRVDDLERRTTALEEEREMSIAAGVGAATRMWGRDCIDGSCAAGKNLDDITAGGAGAIDGDVAMVPADPTYGFLIYLMDDDSAATEALPNIVDLYLILLTLIPLEIIGGYFKVQHFSQYSVRCMYPLNLEQQ